MDSWEIFLPIQISHAKHGFRVVTESFCKILSYIYKNKTEREREIEREVQGYNHYPRCIPDTSRYSEIYF